MGLKKEVFRKSIHFLGVFYYPLYAFSGKILTLETVSLLTLLSLIVEVFRRRYSLIPNWILNPYEVRGVAAHLYFGIAATVLTAFLSPEAAIAGVMIGSVGDGVAGLIKAYQRDSVKQIEQRPYLRKASFIGMFVSSFMFLFFLSTLKIGILKLRFNLRVLVLASLMGAVVESKPIKVRGLYINDNLSVPLLSGIFYQLFS